jgi:hypothetical protein
VVGRFLDRGAIFAGWVGLGMALVIALAFELIIPIQTVVFLLALPMGVLIGVYANVRAERWRPRGRVLTNSAYAGIVTGLGMAILYVLIRLVFIYGDTGGLPDGTSLRCQMGPDCVYQRLVIEEGREGTVGELAEFGITDAKTLEAFAWRELATTGVTLFTLTLGGALIGGLGRAVSTVPRSARLPIPAKRVDPGVLAEES